jgi:hypothetical protein
VQAVTVKSTEVLVVIVITLLTPLSVTGCVRLWDVRQENVCEVLVRLQV